MDAVVAEHDARECEWEARWWCVGQARAKRFVRHDANNSLEIAGHVCHHRRLSILTWLLCTLYRAHSRGLCIIVPFIHSPVLARDNGDNRDDRDAGGRVPPE